MRFLVFSLAVAGMAAGCSAPAPVVSGSSASASGSVSASPAPPSSGSAGTPSTQPSAGTGTPSANAATAKLVQTMESTLKAVVSETSKPAQDVLRSRLESAGIPASAVEVSASKTPTGLDVDAIEAAARSGKDCVMGEIRDSQVSVSVLPVLASGKCFVGDSR
ncbi:MAG TPA: hypothetical protein VJQ60_16775 [Arthrobacter sp.]|nr:hypothetical protein [Arthrobacter sp.]